MKEKINTKYNAGMSLLETIIYVSVLALMLSVVVGSLISLMRSVKFSNVARSLNQSAEISMEKIVREIREANNVDAASVFGTNPGQLVLNTLDDAGSPTTMKIFLNGGVLSAQEGTGTIMPLVATGVSATNLVFRQITTAKSKAIKVEMTLQSSVGNYQISENFYDTAILRGSY